jgi:hypothetical protein
MKWSTSCGSNNPYSLRADQGSVYTFVRFSTFSVAQRLLARRFQTIAAPCYAVISPRLIDSLRTTGKPASTGVPGML